MQITDRKIINNVTMYNIRHPMADIPHWEAVLNRKEEGEACNKLKHNTKQGYSILQNIWTRSIKKANL